MLRQEDGFTLVELLVTISFIGIIMMVMTLTLTNSIKVGKMADRRHQALNLAAMAMEDLQNDDFTNLTSNPYPLSGGYTGLVQVADHQLDGSGQPLLKEITVTVTWSEGEQVRQVQMTTYRAKVLY